MVEQEAVNFKVRGSSPRGGAYRPVVLIYFGFIGIIHAMSETGSRPYIELFHESEYALEGGRNSGPEGARLAAAIELRIQQGDVIYFNTGGNFDDPPLVIISKDTPIIIGGAEWLQCTHERARQLRNQGYTNVVNSHALSYDTFRRS